MATKSHSGKADRPSWWAIANSPLVLLILTCLLTVAGVKFWDGYQDSLKDLAARRDVLGKMLTEYQHRMSNLSTADSKLDYKLGGGPALTHAQKMDPCDKVAAAKWDRETDLVSREEWTVITGRGAYVPTSPEFNGVSLQIIGSEIEHAGGIPDYQFAANRLLGFLDVPPPVTWFFVRVQLHALMSFGLGRTILYNDGEIPLFRGQALTQRQEKILNIRLGSPAELARLRTQNSQLANRIANEPGPPPPKCKASER